MLTLTPSTLHHLFLSSTRTMTDRELQRLSAMLHNMAKAQQLHRQEQGVPNRVSATLSSHGQAPRPPPPLSSPTLLPCPHGGPHHNPATPSPQDDSNEPSLYSFSPSLLLPPSFHDHVLRPGRVPALFTAHPTILTSPASGRRYQLLSLLNRCKYRNYVMLAEPVELCAPSSNSPALQPRKTQDKVVVKVSVFVTRARVPVCLALPLLMCRIRVCPSQATLPGPFFLSLSPSFPLPPLLFSDALFSCRRPTASCVLTSLRAWPSLPPPRLGPPFHI